MVGSEIYLHVLCSTFDRHCRRGSYNSRSYETKSKTIEVSQGRKPKVTS